MRQIKPFTKTTASMLILVQACSQASTGLNSNKIRYKAVQDAALSYGAQSALAWQSNKINAQLSKKQKAIYKKHFKILN